MSYNDPNSPERNTMDADDMLDAADFDADWREEAHEDFDDYDYDEADAWLDELEYNERQRNVEQSIVEDDYLFMDHDDMFDMDSALGSCGWGTDEYYSW